MAERDTWQPAVEAIDASFDEDWTRAESALLEALGRVRKQRQQQIREAR